jgi:hypothetical protein
MSPEKLLLLMSTFAKIEICKMLDLRHLSGIPADCERIYFGHETCEKLLPTFDEIQDLLEISEKRRLKLTFVTPFLTEAGLERVQRFSERLQSARPRSLEIATSDWGLLHWIARSEIGTPVAGRFITGQQLDFRFADIESISREQLAHLSDSTLIKDRTVDMFRRIGIDRFELSNVFQPVALLCDRKYHCSLHVPFVPLTIFRSCPENMDFNCTKTVCSHCSHTRQKWQCDSSEYYIYRLDNALYYSNIGFETQLKPDNKIDRIVWH